MGNQHAVRKPVLSRNANHFSIQEKEEYDMHLERNTRAKL